MTDLVKHIYRPGVLYRIDPERNAAPYEKGPDFETVRSHLGPLTAHLADYARHSARSR